jgi:hypothetical protein
LTTAAGELYARPLESALDSSDQKPARRTCENPAQPRIPRQGLEDRIGADLRCELQLELAVVECFRPFNTERVHASLGDDLCTTVAW